VALYRDGCLQRRLATRLRVRDCSVDGYLAILDAEPAERDRLLRAFAVGVTSFFRNPASWRRLGQLLAERPASPVPFAAWSAGCATGHEAYSIALLLDRLEAAGRVTRAGFTVLGTDLDGPNLVFAEAAVYPPGSAAEIASVVPEARSLAGPDRLELPAEIRRRVRFLREDVTHSSRVAEMDLVLCRNLLIYFGESGQRRILTALVRALRPGGLLMLGKAELAAASVEGIEPVDSRERIYRRVG
jgi:chemotaxis methyl-accepting protein methylase